MSISSIIQSVFSPKKETTTIKKIEPQTKGVVVTDYTTGENVVTKTSGGKVVSQQYTPAPSRSGGGGGSSSSSSPSQLGEEKALAVANRPQGLVQKSVSESPQNIGTITPASTSVSAVSYSSDTLPERQVEVSFGNALGTSIKNVFNFGIIGQQGLEAYKQQAFYEPFRYVGTPQAFNKVGYNMNPSWRGTEFGFGMPDEQKINFTPDSFRDTTSETWFVTAERKKRDIYSQAGLSYAGEPAVNIPQRLGEDVVNDLKPKYEGIIASETDVMKNYYQGEINAGRMSVSDAESQFKITSGKYLDVVNSQFKTEAEGIYSARYGKVAGRIAEVQAFNDKIFEPSAFPIIKGLGTGLEIGGSALIGKFGGSLATNALATYWAVKSEKNTIDYNSNFNQMTTGQKITGGAGVALGWIGTFGIFNLGMNKFYKEYEGLIYSDLASQPARTTGKEVFRTEEFSEYNLATFRQTSNAKAITFQRTDVYPTGVDRAGFFSKGVTYTQIVNPRPYGADFLYSRQAFTSSGYVPNIRQGGLSFVSGGVKSTPENMFSGLGYSKIITGEKVKDVSFISGAKDKGESFQIISGSNLRRGIVNTDYYSAYSNIKGNLNNVGTIQKLQEVGTANFIVTSGKKSSSEFLSSLYGGGTGGASEVGAIQQKNFLSSLTESASKGSSVAFPIVAGASAINAFSLSSPSAETEQSNVQKMFSVQKAQFTQQQSQTPISINALGLSSGMTTEQMFRMSSMPASSLSFSQSFNQGLRLKSSSVGLGATGFNFGFDFTPSLSNGNLPMFFPSLDLGGDSYMNSNFLTGGRRTTRYAPSFSALVFNIRGSYKGGTLAKSGLDFRPITKGFKFYNSRNFF